MHDATEVRDALMTALSGGAALRLGPPVDDVCADVPVNVAVIVQTSGSQTGIGRPVGLSAAALLASADATHQRLGGSGQWVLALPPRHIAGVQVLVRSIRAGIAPVVLPPGPFHAAALTQALASATSVNDPVYTSLVPTQLHRCLDDPAATDALRAASAVLVGGAATSESLLRRARAAGIAVVTTYGMTETCGGCVYDGVPLEGIDVQLIDSRVHLSGPVLAEGYLDEGPQPFRMIDDVRWLETSDVGQFEGGVLQILDRVDDVIVTGGVKVHPAAVERALHATVGEVVVVGVPDPEWGELVTAVITQARSLQEMRDTVGGGPQAPRALVQVARLPTRGPGKVDRIAVREAAVAAFGNGTAQQL